MLQPSRNRIATTRTEAGFRHHRGPTITMPSANLDSSQTVDLTAAASVMAQCRQQSWTMSNIAGRACAEAPMGNKDGCQHLQGLMSCAAAVISQFVFGESFLQRLVGLPCAQPHHRARSSLSSSY